MSFACKEFQVFHFGVIVKLFFFNIVFKLFFLPFIAFKNIYDKHVKVIRSQGK